MSVREMLNTHPRGESGNRDVLTDCIEQCSACSTTCTACADACLAEETVDQLVRCIRLDLDCADICATTASVLTRQTEADPVLVRSLVEACAYACRQCEEECRSHAEHHEHCRVCAEACLRCQQACEEVLSAIGR